MTDSPEKQLYEHEGYSIQQLADKMGLSYTGMRYRLLVQGTKLRAKNGKAKPDVHRNRPR